MLHILSQTAVNQVDFYALRRDGWTGLNFVGTSKTQSLHAAWAFGRLANLQMVVVVRYFTAASLCGRMCVVDVACLNVCISHNSERGRPIGWVLHRSVQIQESTCMTGVATPGDKQPSAIEPRQHEGRLSIS